MSGAERDRPNEFAWEALPPVPDPLGWAGPYVGVLDAGTDDEALLVAGGSNFPRPVWESQKAWHDSVSLLGREEDRWVWRGVGILPTARAHGVALSTPAGVLLIGGGDRDRVLADVLLLSRGSSRSVAVSPLSPLPTPLMYHGAVLVKGVVWVLCGQSDLDLSTATRKVLRAPLDRLLAGENAWETVLALPGPERSLPVVFSQSNGDDSSIFVASGRRLDADGGVEALADLWELRPAVLDAASPDEAPWRRRASPPRCLMGATAIATGAYHALVFGGDDASLFGRADELRDAHPGFSRAVLAYHTVTDSWTQIGEMPEARVTTSAVRFHGGIAIPSGEIRPRVRSTRVDLVRILPTEIGLAGLDYGVIAIYLGALVLLGAYFGRRERSTNDFFLGGRRVPWWAAGLSIYGTQLSAITFMAMPAHVYSHDWVYLLGAMMIVVVAPIVVRVYLPFFRDLEVTSAYEYLERRFHVVVRLAGSLAFVLFQLGRIGVVLFLPALALSTVTGLNVYIAILVLGTLATFYTVLGGIEAVIWTDVLQVFVLLGGAIVCLAVVLFELGPGLGEAFSVARDAGKLRLVLPGASPALAVVWVLVLGRLFEQLVPYTSDQSVVQRYLTTSDTPRAARAIWTNAILSVPGTLLFFAVGTSLWLFYRARPELLSVSMRGGDIFPWFIVQNLPIGVAGLVVAGLFAASMSSLDSSLNSIATALTTDVYRRVLGRDDDRAALRFARIVTFVVGALGTLSALLMAILASTSMWDTYSKLVGLLGSGLAGMFLVGIATRRANAGGALLGFLASALTLGALEIFGGGSVHFFLYPAIGIPICAAVAWGFGLLTGAPPIERLEGLTWRTRRGR